jgi:radical SAM family uncharacterized protein/radical SAM-linked protein
VALAFADVYEIAHSHLGHKILYHLLNSKSGFSAERVYAPWLDYELKLRQTGQPLTSLESHRALSDFDLVGFSLQYELGYTNIINMLKLGRLEPRASLRSDKDPLVVAGGPCASNPEPLADFFDFFFLGDAEAWFMEDLEIIKNWRFEKAPKAELFDRLAGRKGLYIPSLFSPRYDNGRFSAIEPLKSGYLGAERAAAVSFREAPFPCRQITPFVKPVHDRVVVDIARGCSRGCRFCQAGYIYRPVRERPAEEALKLMDKGLKSTGQLEAAFLSLSAGDHSQIETLVKSFMDFHEEDSIALSLPSLRVESLSTSLAEQIKRVRKTGFTIAPEAGSARLRAVINKNLSEEDALKAAEAAFKLGWRSLKLYFMCGLPTETDDDLSAIADLVMKIKKIARLKLSVGLAHFTPKAHTPFQWLKASKPDEIAARLEKVKAQTRRSGASIGFSDPGASFIECLLARGDRRLGSVLEKVSQAGARFEAWNDRFRLDYWLEALESEASLGLDLANLLIEEKDTSQNLPWSHLFCGVKTEFLIKELGKAYQGLSTPDCRLGGCGDCGACRDGVKIDLAKVNEKNHKGPSLEVNSPQNTNFEAPAASVKAKVISPKAGLLQQGFRYAARFTKDWPMVLLGHLEMVELFKRAFRRAGLKLMMSQGFHPQPKMSFLTALPVGVVSLDEYLLFSLREERNSNEIMRCLSLPDGLKINYLEKLSSLVGKIKLESAVWEVSSAPAVFFSPPLLHPSQVSYTGAKGKILPFVDLVSDLKILSPEKVSIKIKAGLEGTPRPEKAVRALWELAEEDGPILTVVKTSTNLV